MTRNLFFDWALMAVSLANMVLLLWLGLTVLLNTERRGWGHWLGGGGLLLGAAFFVSHSAILFHGLNAVDRGLQFWWRIGLSPAIFLPFAWYTLTLWYTGFWEDRHSTLRQRQQPWFLLAIALLFLGGIGYFLVASPTLPSSELVQLRSVGVDRTIQEVPLAALGYALYIVLCVALSLDALGHPGPARRAMGDLARQRARPWLIGTSLALLGVGLLVGWAIFWILPDTRMGQGLYVITDSIRNRLARMDLAVASLVGVGVVLLGQAIVSYEVFTGKTLPRQGFQRYWRYAVAVAIGYGVLVGGTLALPIRPIYGLLLSTGLMTFFLALLSWRSYVERERYIRHLRPFVASQGVVQHLLDLPSLSHDAVDTSAPFQALCRDVLGARFARLVPLGPLASFIGSPLTYPPAPAGHAPEPAPESIKPTIEQFTDSRVRYLALEPALHGGAAWAVSLWHERGLMGLLLLGPKRDGGLYTQEEMEIAAASGERLLDTQASAEVARRLVLLQRQRMAESQVLDRQTRRVLHDDVLPTLHAAILALSNGHGPERTGEAVTLLTDAHHNLSDLLREMPHSTLPTLDRRGLLAALRQVVEDEWGQAFSAVRWQVEPETDQKLLAVSPLAAEVLFYAAREAIRNAARHGRRADGGPLSLCIRAVWRDGLELYIEDDGVGMGAVTATDGSGGQGLALHSTMMAVIGGALVAERRAPGGSRVILTLPQAS